MSNDEDFLFRGDISELAPEVSRLIEREAERQARKLIMIPSESSAPLAVRQALGSVFQNVYAEGYPAIRAIRESEALLLDEAHQLVYFRRYGDRRFYKGVDYVDIVEALAGRRAAQCFATDEFPAETIYANVQALSGSPANLAIYDAFMQAGDTLMGLDLFQGGHLTHGSEFNISGKRYKVVSYGVDPKTEKLDYARIRELALQHRPRVIVAGYTSYSWAPDWNQFRQIADAAGAILMADIAHTAGLVMGGIYPNPVGLADVTVFTTHKTLCGPRAAVILTTDPDKAGLIDRAVFPGAQGGPHVNKFAALCVLFKLARTERFRQLQRRTVENARALDEAFKDLGLRVVYGGTDTHIVVLDVSTVESPARRKLGYPLRGEIAARLLDLAGIVVNKNTIPGDKLTALASGIRFGTPWVSQRGLGLEDMKAIAGIVHRVLTNIQPFAYHGLAGELPRGKIDLDVLEKAKRQVAALTDRAGIDFTVKKSGYPHFFGQKEDESEEKSRILEISGRRARAFVQEISTANLAKLEPGQAARTFLLDGQGLLLDDVAITRLLPDGYGRDLYLLAAGPGRVEKLKAWLRGLADGYILFDEDDLFRKVQGPVVVRELGQQELAVVDVRVLESAGPAAAGAGERAVDLFKAHPERFDLTVPYFVGQSALKAFGPQEKRSEWSWSEPAERAPRRTALYEIHKRMGARMVPFAGWEMPVWYSSVSEEHQAVRRAAGLFDVSHMGCFEVSGPQAISFLDTVLSNYIHWLDDGQSCYAYLLDPDGGIIDDLMVYRRRADRFLVVVNAANEDKDWSWLNAVNERRVIIDRRRPWLQVEAPAVLRNLKDPAAAEQQLRDLALQGPHSLAVLQACTEERITQAALARLARTNLTDIELSGIPVIAARTGYTGEDIGFELFVHPDAQVDFWNMLLGKGAPFGIKPCGLAARDSTRTEAGLPLYGHELAGPFDVSPSEAGFPGYVKYHKPFFVGRDPLLARDMKRERAVIRWRLNQKGMRRPNQGDPVVSKNGLAIGHVTSCSIDREGYLLGMAIVNKNYAEEGLPVSIFVLTAGARQEKQKLELKMGDKVSLPVGATVLRRFPVKGGSTQRAAED